MIRRPVFFFFSQASGPCPDALEARSESMKLFSKLMLCFGLAIVGLGCDSGKSVEIPDNPAPPITEEGDSAIAPPVPAIPDNPNQSQ